ncbi:hypothetical protein [Caballeronia sp. LZ024]|uniref:hypothetical protein n=1 Tax=Caballeronia sp. LZ024 TaxID=3038561 RepID=UPI002858C827|nr:hypothetical protein [Caballeronia sp. LZ024]MDR5749639.1 hypothetical protein [Caballeronia sp. LZ024]
MKWKVESKVAGSSEMNGWRRARMAVVALGLAAMLSGCSIFGCGGAASNGGFFGGCGAGMRF